MTADQPPIVHLKVPAHEVRTWRSPRLNGAHDIDLKKITVNGKALVFGYSRANTAYMYGGGLVIRVTDGARRFTVQAASARASLARVRVTYRVTYHRFRKH